MAFGLRRNSRCFSSRAHLPPLGDDGNLTKTEAETTPTPTPRRNAPHFSFHVHLAHDLTRAARALPLVNGGAFTCTCTPSHPHPDRAGVVVLISKAQLPSQRPAIRHKTQGHRPHCARAPVRRFVAPTPSLRQVKKLRLYIVYILFKRCTLFEDQRWDLFPLL